MSARKRQFLVALAMVPAMACGARSDVDDPATQHALQIAAACEKLADAQCRKFEECKPKTFRHFFGTHELCVSDRSQACIERQSIDGVRTREEDLRACGAATAAQPCAGVAWFDEPALPECRMRPGTKPLGARCNGGACAEGLACEDFGDDGCGRCVPLAREGDACPVNYCNGAYPVMMTGGTGRPPALTCIDSRCVRPLDRGEGEPCASNDERCKLGLRCDSVTLRCVRYPDPSLCGAFHADSAGCDPLKDWWCPLADGEADGGYCYAPESAAIGESCTRAMCAAEALCDESGVCVPRHDVGGACEPDRVPWPCLPGLICSADGRCERPPVPSCR